MQRSAALARSQQTTILCTVGTPLIFSQRMFEQLGTTLVKVRGGEELLRELSSMRPIGVFLMVTDLDQLPERGWLQELEHKILFEGLRVVLAIGTKSENPARIFSSKAMGHAHLVKCLGLRDLVIFNDSLNDQEIWNILERVKFAFGLSSHSPFGSSFGLLARHEEPLEISLPGRISVIEDDCHLVIESAVFIAPGTRIKMRLMGTEGDPVDVPVQALENFPSGLRFNFGNSIRVRLGAESASVMRKLVDEEDPQRVVNRPMRRALVVTRSVLLRQRLVAALSLGQVESRIPLVRRNIRGDLPPLSPQFLVIEPSALASTTAAEAIQEVEEYLKLAGPQCQAVIVGRRLDWQIAPSFRIAVLPDDSNLDDSLAALLSESSEEESDPRRARGVWFTQHSCRSKVMLVLRENARFVAEEGFVFESQQIYRMWGNLEVRGIDSRAHLIGRITRTERIEDSFRNAVRLGPRHSSGFSTYVASIGSSPLLQKTFKDALKMSSKVLPSPIAQLRSSQEKPTAVGRTLSAVAANKTASVLVDQAEELGYATGRSEQKRSGGRPTSHRTGPIVVMVIFALAIGGFIAYGLLFGFSETKVYGESFQKLFEMKGKPQRSP